MIHIDLISNMRMEPMRAGPRSLASSSRSPAGRKRAERNLALVDERFDGGPVDQDLDRLDMPRLRRRIALAGHRLVREGHGRASDAEVQGRAIGDLDLGQDEVWAWRQQGGRSRSRQLLRGDRACGEHRQHQRDAHTG